MIFNSLTRFSDECFYYERESVWLWSFAVLLVPISVFLRLILHSMDKQETNAGYVTVDGFLYGFRRVSFHSPPLLCIYD